MTKQFNPDGSAEGAKLVTSREAVGGELCSACSKSLEPGEIEYEVQVRSGLWSSVLRFHVRCYAIWSGESEAD